MPRGSFVSASCAEWLGNRDDLMSLLANMSLGQWILAVLMIGICGLLMLVILLQKGRGGGLAGAFGGGGGGSSAFGAKTGDVFTWITVVVACMFLVLNVVANFAFDQSPKAESPVTAVPAPLETQTIPVNLDGTTLIPVSVDPSTGNLIEAKDLPSSGAGETTLGQEAQDKPDQPSDSSGGGRPSP